MAMDNLRPTGPKKNHKRGYAAADRARKREEAEKRNAEYSKLSYEKKMEQNSSKVRTKLTRQAAK
jgi:hypothetical protein